MSSGNAQSISSDMRSSGGMRFAVISSLKRIGNMCAMLAQDDLRLKLSFAFDRCQMDAHLLEGSLGECILSRALLDSPARPLRPKEPQDRS